MDRRIFLRSALVGAGVAAFSGAVWETALAAPAQPGAGPYGPLAAAADGNGVLLPSGFTSRILARTNQVVAGTGYRWHGAPDGGACFPNGSGWMYVSNCELPLAGGASVLRFDASGTIISAQRLLSGTSGNCAGGPTPWGTWLSCEEHALGRVWETYPATGASAVARTAMGRFTHEAAACDPVRQVVYLTEDKSDGCFYRFRPNTWGDLSSGTLEVLCGPTDSTSGTATWQRVPNPTSLLRPTRRQVSAAKHFDGGEGCYYANGLVWWTTKGDNRVWKLDCATDAYELAYDDSLVTSGTAPLTGVDNITGSRSGDLFVAEDGGNLEICVITPDGVVAPFLRLAGHEGSEITGPAFSPDGSRLYFSSQRGTSDNSFAGMTFEVKGPFRV
ncbi:DUF839 domain-containing protein [Frankia sp. CNm7]|uniref:DUF839 domain-containing protein n=1 Tax=Frankia nepalensis TaxID=1836974 RepID=A0A937URN8_9ACTN|nr:alkaline phosphatase PhoX [Frankia nepalensis]MBL7501425.1 DUF839 domain-containing protein [Frankia nepalensis]MBL7510012.1 DUF839 domain-containing protein [Frankia nepalensis]MBL7517136.1 DUF839 domain-containing protein [Frankia nepalensis]MBL7627976.1 DUF839 domain-containing protein [Frankia nepalensis]